MEVVGMTDEELRRKIAERAYFYFLERGGEHGHDIEDWLRAEREVLTELNQTRNARQHRTSSKKSARGATRGRKSRKRA